MEGAKALRKKPGYGLRVFLDEKTQEVNMEGNKPAGQNTSRFIQHSIKREQINLCRFESSLESYRTRNHVSWLSSKATSTLGSLAVCVGLFCIEPLGINDRVTTSGHQPCQVIKV
jgi:hypothetical protein